MQELCREEAPPYPGTHSPISYALPPLPMKQPATSPPAASIPHRKAAGGPAIPHHTPPLEGHTRTLRLTPFPIRPRYRLQGQRRARAVVSGRGGWTVAGQEAVLQGAGGERSRGGSRGGGFSRVRSTRGKARKDAASAGRVPRGKRERRQPARVDGAGGGSAGAGAMWWKEAASAARRPGWGV